MRQQRKQIKQWAKDNLIGKIIEINMSFVKLQVKFTVSGIKEALNQPHKHEKEKNDIIINITEIIINAPDFATGTP